MKRGARCASATGRGITICIGITLLSVAMGCQPILRGAEVREGSLIVPGNVMNGRVWDVVPLTRTETLAFLSQPLPPPGKLRPDITIQEVLAGHCGKRVIWLPPEAEPKAEAREPRFSYARMFGESSPDEAKKKGIAVGEAIEGLLTALTGGGTEWSMSISKERDDDLMVFVVLVTRSNLYIMAIPRDYLESSLPPIPGK
jgi:hypothetical protein